MTTSLRFEEVAAAAEVAKLLLSITVRSDKTAILHGRLNNYDCQSDNRIKEIKVLRVLSSGWVSQLAGCVTSRGRKAKNDNKEAYYAIL